MMNSDFFGKQMILKQMKQSLILRLCQERLIDNIQETKIYRNMMIYWVCDNWSKDN